MGFVGRAKWPGMKATQIAAVLIATLATIRAALDFAIEHGIPHGGWRPKGLISTGKAVWHCACAPPLSLASQPGFGPRCGR